ncbi:hypothetical protein GCM10011519_24690 [Marmoricola endophyticus]|uniref:Uncharacterized protein n=1 Tax=Marmoricola endophyticus TaxID=2040280 RepID=A0A917F6Y2_9ACTN|nr:hypothetical protein [Marmoricola endophyticus]GGF49792.1 hypothetical protein GCM10011519_24690 [Marmoricola endophyticus]
MDTPNAEHTRPSGVSDETVEAVDTFTRALETIEVARGHLMQFHRLTGTGDTQLRESVEQLRAAGHRQLADDVERHLVGRNVLEGRWTFQLVEEYDDHYFSLWRELEARAREELLGGRRHLLEAEMKEANRTHGHPRHTAAPADGA